MCIVEGRSALVKGLSLLGGHPVDGQLTAQDQNAGRLHGQHSTRAVQRAAIRFANS